MKTKLEIQDFEDKKTKESNMRYTRFKTSDGWMSCFDKKTATDLCNPYHQHCEVNVEVEKNADFFNITKFYGKVMDGEMTPEAQIPSEFLKPENLKKENWDKEVDEARKQVNTQIDNYKRKSVKGSAYEKDPVGLAVEVFNTLSNAIAAAGEPRAAIDIMKIAIDTVKQAQEAFS